MLTCLTPNSRYMKCGGTYSGLNIQGGRSKILKVNSASTVLVTLGEEAIEEVEHFTYLGSVVDTQGETEADAKVRIDKAMVDFLQLKNIWKSKVLSLKNKIMILIITVTFVCSSLRIRDMEEQ